MGGGPLVGVTGSLCMGTGKNIVTGQAGYEMREWNMACTAVGIGLDP